MSITRLAHYSVRTDDLNASCRFYVEIIGLRVGSRPPFDFPGAWLYPGDDESELGMVHLIGSDESTFGVVAAYLGDRPALGLQGSGAVDHIAFLATDWAEMQARCDSADVDYTLRQVPALGLLQIFLTDPSGVTIELNFATQ